MLRDPIQNKLMEMEEEKPSEHQDKQLFRKSLVDKIYFLDRYLSGNVEDVPQREHIYANAEDEYQDTMKALIREAGERLLEKGLPTNYDIAAQVIQIPLRDVTITPSGHWSDDTRYSKEADFTSTDRVSRKRHTRFASFSLYDLANGVVEGKIDFNNMGCINQFYNDNYQIVKKRGLGEVIFATK